MHSFAKRLAPVAAILLAMSSAVYAGKGDGDRGGRDHSRSRDNDFIWRHHENGCAVGNTPPPGANCTGRDDTQQNR